MSKAFIIEDDVNILVGLQAKLKVAGFEVEISSGEEDSIQELISKIRGSQADFLILDLILPNLDGFKIIKTLRGEEDLADLPVFIFTDVSEEDKKQRGLDVGANYYFLKEEINLDDLAQKIRRIIKNNFS